MAKAKDEKIELRPDGWNRFETAVDIAVKTPPKHHVPTKQAAASKSRPRSGKSKR